MIEGIGVPGQSVQMMLQQFAGSNHASITAIRIGILWHRWPYVFDNQELFVIYSISFAMKLLLSNFRYAHYMIPDKRGDKAGITEIQLKCCEVKWSKNKLLTLNKKLANKVGTINIKTINFCNYLSFGKFGVVNETIISC